MELIDFQYSEVFKSNFLACYIFDFFQNDVLPSGPFSTVKTHTKQAVSTFGNIYRRDQLFSKSTMRSQLQNNHLSDLFLLTVCPYLPPPPFGLDMTQGQFLSGV